LAAADKSVRLLFENSRELMVIIGHDGLLKEVNPAWTTAIGWSAEDLIGRSGMDFVHVDDLAMAKAASDLLRSTGACDVTLRIMLKGGGYRWFSGYHVVTQAGGDMLGILRDVTAERAREAELEDARRTREMLAEAAGIGAWGYNPETDIYSWSPEFCTLVGYTPDELQERMTYDSLIHPDDRARVYGAYFASISTGAEDSVLHRFLAKDGRWIVLRATFKTEPTASGSFALRGLSQDVTELAEALDAAKAASEAKASFLANMSHEIRTPMNGILGVMHLLSNEPLTPDGKSLLREAAACGQMLAALLNDVLDFSKIEAGMLELRPEPLNPGHLIEGVASLIRPQAEEKGLRLTVDRAGAAGWVSADPVRLRQILFNLVGNAVKFTLEGEITVKARTFEGPHGQRLRLEVTDTGVGISDEAQTGLFQRFSQGDASTTRRFGGTGLGLAITQRLAEMMGGEAGVTSALGKGSTFWIEIDAPAADAGTISQVTEAGLLNGLSILVVEDNRTNRMIATKMLENLGASVQVAEDGEQGVEAAAHGAFDLILMDIQMPGIDGVEATRRIRALRAPIRDLPIIALTANVMAHQRQDYLNAGMNGVVGKPISPRSLLTEIARVMDDDAQSAGGPADAAASA